MIKFNLSGKYQLKPQAVNSEPFNFNGKYKLKPSPPSRRIRKPDDPLVPSFPIGNQTIFDEPCTISGENLIFLYEYQWSDSASLDGEIEGVSGIEWSSGSEKFFYSKGLRTYATSRQGGLQMNNEVSEGFNYTRSFSSSGTSHWHYTFIPEIILDAIAEGETGGSSTSNTSEVSYGHIGRGGWYLFYGMVTYVGSYQTNWSFSCSHS